MQGALRVVESLAGAVGLGALWFLALFVLPLGVMLYVGLLFPLTGQWRKSWPAARVRRLSGKKKNGAT